MTRAVFLTQIKLFCLLYCLPEPNFDPSIANCDFEEGFCEYHQERAGGSVWNRVSVKPNVYRVGDHTTGTGEKQETFREQTLTW